MVYVGRLMHCWEVFCVECIMLVRKRLMILMLMMMELLQSDPPVQQAATTRACRPRFRSVLDQALPMMTLGPQPTSHQSNQAENRCLKLMLAEARYYHEQ
jgi:hypothetical protein